MNSKLIAGLILLCYTISFPQTVGVSRAITTKVVIENPLETVEQQYEYLKLGIKNLQTQESIIKIQKTTLENEKTQLEHR